MSLVGCCISFPASEANITQGTSGELEAMLSKQHGRDQGEGKFQRSEFRFGISRNHM